MQSQALDSTSQCTLSGTSRQGAVHQAQGALLDPLAPQNRRLEVTRYNQFHEGPSLALGVFLQVRPNPKGYGRSGAFGYERTGHGAGHGQAGFSYPGFTSLPVHRSGLR
jgi:hypothetical protein